MAIWGSAIGGVAALAGGVISGKSQKKAAKKASKAAQFRPGNVTGLSGNATFNKDALSGQWNLGLTLAPQEQMIRNQLQGRSLTELQGGEFGDVGSFLRRTTAPTFSDLYNEMQSFNALLPETALETADQFSGLADATTAAGLGGIFAGLSGPSGINAANRALDLGGNLLSGAGSPSFNQLAAERLTALRGMAKPAEDRLVNSRINNLFSKGRLGTTGGSQILSDLGEALGREDMARIVSAQDFAQGQLNQERQFMQGQQGLGASLFELGLRGINAEQGFAMNQGNFGAELLRLAAANRTGAMGAVEAYDTSTLSRGQNRLLAAQNMFNFGDALDANSLERGLQLLGGAQTIDQTLLDQARIGASVGSAQASAGANAGQLRMAGSGSILGGALSGIGAGLLAPSANSNSTSPLATLFSGLFNRQPAASTASTGYSPQYLNTRLFNLNSVGGN